MADALSVVHITIDSLNRHALAAYGFGGRAGWAGTATPNLDAFARRAVTFENHRTGSLACMPARREMWTGRTDFVFRPWGPVEPFDVTVAGHFDRLRPERGVAALVTDHFHFFEHGSHGYYEDFYGYEFVRGHEMDMWRTAPLPDRLPGWAQRLVDQGERYTQYVRNALPFAREQDFFAPRVMTAAADWLGANAGHDPFYLMVDSFDVHEPFHVPEPYRSMYTDLSPDDHTCWPPYGRMGWGALAGFDGDDLAFAKAQYRGKVTMADRWLGRVFDALDEQDLWDRTVVIVTADHGHYLGEDGWVGKPSCAVRDTMNRIPLFVHHPDATPGARVQAMTQTVDLYPTVLETLGQTPRSRPDGRSLVPLLTGDSAADDLHGLRTEAVYGYFGRQMNVTDGRWSYHRQPIAGNQPLYQFSAHTMNPNEWFDAVEPQPEAQGGRWLDGVDQPVWRTPCAVSFEDEPPMLFDLGADPLQETNLHDDRPDQVARMTDALRRELGRLGAPESQFERFAL